MKDKPKALYVDGLYLDDVTEMLSSRYDLEIVDRDELDDVLYKVKDKRYDLVVLPLGKNSIDMDISGFELSDRIKRSSPETKTFVYSHCITASDPVFQHIIEPAMRKYRKDCYCQVSHDLAAYQMKMCLDSM